MKCYICYSSIIILAVLLVISRCYAECEWKAEIKADSKPYVLGAAIPIDIEIYHNSEESIQLVFMFNGVPEYMRLRLNDSSGNEVNINYKKNEIGRPIDLPPISKTCAIAPNDKVKLKYELDDYFKIDKPGIYKVRLVMDKDVELASSLIKINDIKEIYELSAEGLCSKYPGLSPQESFAAIRKFKGIVGYSEIEIKGEKKGYVSISITDISEEPNSCVMKRTYYDVPTGVKILRCEIDFHWRVWILIEKDGKKCLLINNIYDKSLVCELNWTDMDIKLETSTAYQVPFKIIFVLNEGKILINSLEKRASK